jgi:hypothetical protein
MQHKGLNPRRLVSVLDRIDHPRKVPFRFMLNLEAHEARVVSALVALSHEAQADCNVLDRHIAFWMIREGRIPVGREVD